MKETVVRARVSEAEKAGYEKAAEKAGISMADWIRGRLNGDQPPATNDNWPAKGSNDLIISVDPTETDAILDAAAKTDLVLHAWVKRSLLAAAFIESNPGATGIDQGDERALTIKFDKDDNVKELIHAAVKANLTLDAWAREVLFAAVLVDHLERVKKFRDMLDKRDAEHAANHPTVATLDLDQAHNKLAIELGESVGLTVREWVFMAMERYAECEGVIMVDKECRTIIEKAAAKKRCSKGEWIRWAVGYAIEKGEGKKRPNPTTDGAPSSEAGPSTEGASAPTESTERRTGLKDLMYGQSDPAKEDASEGECR